MSEPVEIKETKPSEGPKPIALEIVENPKTQWQVLEKIEGENR